MKIQGKSRIVKSKDKIIVTKYIKTLYDALDRLQVFSLQTALESDALSPDEVEALDAIIGDQEDIAEQKCRPRRPEYYSKTLVQHRFQVSILRRHLNALRKDQDRTEQLTQKMQRVGITVPLPPTQTLTRRAQRLQDLSSPKDKPLHKIISAIKKVEANMKTYQILKVMKTSNEVPITLDRIEVPRSWPPSDQPVDRSVLEDPKTCEDWKVVTDPSELEHYLLLRNRIHFGQAEVPPSPRRRFLLR